MPNSQNPSHYILTRTIKYFVEDTSMILQYIAKQIYICKDLSLDSEAYSSVHHPSTCIVSCEYHSSSN